MIVKPKKKKRKLNSNEIRVININQSAIEELLWEYMLESQAKLFDVERVDQDKICSMEWDQSSGNLTYVVMPISYMLEGKKPNFEVLRKKVGITTTSLFSPNRYCSLDITDSMLLKD